ncbi:MAG: 3-isopropylmalate dehydratase small subunit [Candidatus Hadarchaeales archaeon]
MSVAKVFVYGDNISTDDIIAGRYLSKHDPRWWGSHAMENIDPEFTKKVERGDVIIGGKNFGCGSSREQAPIALKEAGVAAVVAESFARIFYRNAINQGLPALACPEIKGGFKTGDEISVDFLKGEVKNLTTKKVFLVQPLPEFILNILRAGGLASYMRRKMRK